MKTKAPQMLLVVAGIVVGILMMQFINDPASARDFRARSTDQTRTAPAAQAQPTEPAASPRAEEAAAQPQQPIVIMPADEDPVQRYETDMVSIPEEIGMVVIAITDTKTGVVRVTEVRARSSWQELSF